MSGVQSVQRAIRILEALALEPSGVSELARKVELPKSTVARLLATLEEADAIERADDGQRYRIGRVVRGLSGSGPTSLHLSALAQPHLERLARATGEASGLGIPDGYRLHYLAQIESESAVQIRDWTGETVPMHLVPSGLVVMAQWPNDLLDEFLARPLERATANSVADPDEIRLRLAAIRDAGHAWVFEEFVEGLNSVAAPVFDGGGRVVAAVHVHGPAYRFPRHEVDAMGRHVSDAAARLTGVVSLGLRPTRES